MAVRMDSSARSRPRPPVCAPTCSSKASSCGLPPQQNLHDQCEDMAHRQMGVVRRGNPDQVAQPSAHGSGGIVRKQRAVPADGTRAFLVQGAGLACAPFGVMDDFADEVVEQNVILLRAEIVEAEVQALMPGLPGLEHNPHTLVDPGGVVPLVGVLPPEPEKLAEESAARHFV